VLHLIVAFRDPVPMPVFPRPRTDLPRTDPANLLIENQTDSLIRVIRGLRAGQYTDDSMSLSSIRVAVRGHFWLIQAIVVEAKVGRLPAIDSLPSAAYVRAVETRDEPPNTCPDGTVDLRCANDVDDDDIAQAVELIGMKDWKAIGYEQGWMGVLDTGVYTEHDLLKEASASGMSIFQCEKDCPTDCPDDAEKCTDCIASNPGDLCGPGHGTSTAGILVGRSASFPRHEGMTRASLDWFTVYDQDCQGDCGSARGSRMLNACAAIRAFEFSIRRGNPVIVAEVAANADADDDRDPIDRAAAHAFETNRAIIAAAGNSPMGSPVAGPAREATVIAVGARYSYDWVEDPASMPTQRYSTVGGRSKPELLAPTKTEAPARCFSQAFQFFSYTSGATPYVGGTASILNEWIAKTVGLFDAGHTYAQLILSGSRVADFSNPKWGVGLLNVPPPTTTTTWLDKEELGSGGIAYIDLPGATDDLRQVDAALWWPESQRPDGSRPHHHVQLELLDVHDNVVEVSKDPSNVFQRLSVPRSRLGPVSEWRLHWRTFSWCFFGWCWSFHLPWIDARGWRIRITELTTMDTGEVQTVYWTVAGRR
jgi:hypothetical protein